MRVLDVSDPSNPEEVGYYKIATSTGIDSDSEYIYLGTAAYGFYILDFEPLGIENGPGSAPELPSDSWLYQNYPNPFNPRTSISFSLPGESGKSIHVKLKIYNLRGKPIKTLVDTELPPGSHRVIWDGRDDSGVPVPSGVYLYRLGVGGRTAVRKMTVLR
jgi:hypothetical protein